MPGGDKTGPFGAGAMTGRGVGYCAGYNRPGYMNPGVGRGYGRGFGMGFGRGGGRGFGRGGGRGWRNMYYATGQPGWARAGYAPAPEPEWGPAPYPQEPVATRADELAGLKDQARYFKEALDDINKRISELENKS